MLHSTPPTPSPALVDVVNAAIDRHAADPRTSRNADPSRRCDVHKQPARAVSLALGGLPVLRSAMSAVLSTEVSTLPELLATRSREIGDEPFLRYADVRWTYGEFAGRVTEVAGGLRASGVRRGDVVGVVLRNGPEYLEVWWAILWLGATFNPVNPDADRPRGGPDPGRLGRHHGGLQRGGCRGARGAPGRAARAAPADRGDEGHGRPARVAARRRQRGPAGSDRARRPRRVRLHLRHHRPAEGRDAHATPTSWPTPGCSPSCCRSGAATCWAWCCRCST